MNRIKAALILPVVAALAGCQTAADGKTEDQARAEKLEQRVLELERQLVEQKAHPVDPETQLPAPIVVGGQSFQPVPATAPPAPARTRSTRTSTPARKPAPARPPVAAPAPEPAQEASAEPVRRDEREPFDGDERESDSVRASRERVRHDIPAGTQMTLVLESPLSSATSQVGDEVTARLQRAVGEDGRPLFPGGAYLKGEVIEARGSGRVSGRAALGVAFNQVVVGGRSYPLTPTEVRVEAQDSHKRDAGVVAGGTVAGAILGGIADGGKGAKRGAIIGAAAGAGAVLATRGQEVVVESGTTWTVRAGASSRQSERVDGRPEPGADRYGRRGPSREEDYSRRTSRERQRGF